MRYLNLNTTNDYLTNNNLTEIKATDITDAGFTYLTEEDGTVLINYNDIEYFYKQFDQINLKDMLSTVVTTVYLD